MPDLSCLNSVDTAELLQVICLFTDLIMTVSDKVVISHFFIFFFCFSQVSVLAAAASNSAAETIIRDIFQLFTLF